ncbi:universal stress protein [Cereibacter sphaeroides]|uniref:Universal stress protein n=1 Tax=Cereibacter sphaeroides TaxID=1063 RepID=A0AAX1UKB5_CERSP|nr:universal stress protein [Cereibacter sphaeroides]RHZ94669.1 universal stress protein [Cereibacter sphaeroides]
MYQHILIATDGSETAGKGLDHGLTLARALGAKVTIITVTEAFPLYAASAGEAWVAPVELDTDYEARQKERAEGILKDAREAADRMGVSAEVLHVPGSLPAEAIVEAARSRDCSLICMSSHGRRGLGRLLLGSQTAEVLAHSPVPVLVVR